MTKSQDATYLEGGGGGLEWDNKGIAYVRGPSSA